MSYGGHDFGMKLLSGVQQCSTNRLLHRLAYSLISVISSDRFSSKSLVDFSRFRTKNLSVARISDRTGCQ